VKDASAEPSEGPRNLVVVGAAAGVGRVLCQHLFSTMSWEGVVLVDRAEALDQLRVVATMFPLAPDLAVFDEDGQLEPTRGSAALDAPSTVVCLAVPVAELGQVALGLVDSLADDAVVIETSAPKTDARDTLGPVVGERYVFGIRALFDTVLSLDGQTVVVTPMTEDDPRTDWFARAVEERGGIIKVTSAEGHDRAMARVQTLTQQSLLGFADSLLTTDGLDLEADLWEMRTPAFETLLGLAVRVLGEHQQRTIASLHTTPSADDVAETLAAGQARLREATHSHDPARMGDYLTSLRDRFSGSLFETIHGTATAVVGAAQAKRAELSRQRREGTPVGLIPHDRPDDLRVGTIVHLSPTEVTLDEIMVGERGSAFILVGEGRRNARKSGVGGKPRRTRFMLGRSEVVSGPALEAELTSWLAHLPRDVRFLVPESVAGEGVVNVLAETQRVRTPTLVSEVVRTGQRAVVVRVFIRSDADIEATVEEMRARVGRAYAWPAGLSLPRSATTVPAVSYLGPPGTFSETGAEQCAQSLGIATPRLVPRDSFEHVLAAVDDGEMGVLPICSSASGLVDRAAAAILGAPGELEAGGVVDVPVRFDAYVRPGVHLDDLRGAPVVSHPQVLLQCRRFIQRWGLVPREASSTAEAGEIVAASDEPCVALAGAGLGTSRELRVAESEVDDLSGSLTRFLVLGRPGTFGEMTGGSDPTLRTVWIASSNGALASVLSGKGPAFDEFITASSGRTLLVTSRTSTASHSDVRSLGRVPWTPRTPLVRLES